MALIFGLAVFYAVRRWPRRIAPVIAVGAPLLMAAWPVVFERLYGPFFTAPEIYRHLPDSSQARIDIWNFVTARITEKPVLGWGIETARSMPGGTDEYMPGRTHLPLHPHNSVLNVLLEEGLVGFLLSLGGLFVVFHTWRRTGRDDPARLASAGAAIVAYLAVGFTAFGVWQTWWIACAWIAAVLFRRVAEPHAPSSSRP
jgi:O-antigen ligase